MKTIDTVVLNKPDRFFIRDVEHASGQDVSLCYQCGNCTGGCPMTFEYDYTVSRLMRMIQAGQKELVLSSRSIWMCASCETCTQRCPKNIDVATIMDVCRHMARREGKKSVYPVKSFADGFNLSVRLFGRMHELTVMGTYMLRTLKFWTDLDLAPNTFLKGKMPLLPHLVKGHKEVSAIMKRFRQGAGEEAVVRARMSSLPAVGGALDTSGPSITPASVVQEDPCAIGGAPIGLDALDTQLPGKVEYPPRRDDIGETRP